MSTTHVTPPDVAARRPLAAARPQVADLTASLRRGVMLTSRRLRAERTSGTTEAQYCVLVHLHEHGESTPSALAAQECVSAPTMTRTLGGLVDAALVSRSEHPDDRRQTLVSLTEAGHGVVRSTRRRRDEWLSRRLADLTDDERDVLSRAAIILRSISAT